MQLSQGKYLLLKDPNNQKLILYSIPEDTFSSSEDESSDDDEGLFQVNWLFILFHSPRASVAHVNILLIKQKMKKNPIKKAAKSERQIESEALLCN